MSSARLRVWIAWGVVVLLATVLIVGPSEAGKKADKEEAASTRVDRWLVLGPTARPLPAFGDEEKHSYGLGDLLDQPLLPDVRIRPAAGDAVRWPLGGEATWQPASNFRQGRARLEPVDTGEGAVPSVAWLAGYVSNDAWMKVKLIVDGQHARRVWLDGEPVASGGKKEDDGAVEAEVELISGDHVVLVQTVFDPARDLPWTPGVRFTAGKEEPAPQLVVGLDPSRRLNLADVLDPPTVGSVALSPDGTRTIASINSFRPGTHDRESWVEIRSTSGAVLGSWRGSKGVGSVSWSPDGRWVAWTADTPGKEAGRSIYLRPAEGGAPFPLLQGVKKLGGYRWSPDGTGIVYSTSVEAEKDKRGVKRFQALLDRLPGYHDRSFLNLVQVPGGARVRLTAGDASTSMSDFSPDGKRLLFTRTFESLEQRPYSRTELWELELATLKAKKLREFGWLGDANYGPDGRRILIQGDAEMFDGVGRNVPQGTVVNNYDSQLFVWEPASDEVVPLTRDFDPAIQASAWSRHDGAIYATGEDRDHVRLYRFDPAGGEPQALDAGVDRLRRFALAERAPVALVTGSSPWLPQQLVRIDLAGGGATRLTHPAGDWFSDVESGTVEPWSFETAAGRTIDGRVYLPPGFDAGKSYPVIVYYYGGTSPITREFGGRYPKDWWASHGYVVYVPQPSGATGYGQEFAARHVNDWGETTTTEVIEGARAFLEAHPYVDPERVGCIGASYGGFMTMSLATKTDLFAAAVSHAGISSLSSYWGEGYWGYSYGAVANADSFPWNRKDIFVDRSPLFNADQAQVPILLTHGAADTNVPRGESDAFYIALKLLGKEVEYLQIDGQDHWILDHAKRELWSHSIVAWFDRWLKDQPEWWNELYPAE